MLKPSRNFIVCAVCTFVLLIAIIGYLRQQDTQNTEQQKNKKQARAVISQLKQAFAKLPAGDTTAVELGGNISALKLVSVGKDKIAVARFENQVAIYLANDRRAALLKAQKLKPLELQEF